MHVLQLVETENKSEEIRYFEYFDLQKIETPVDAQCLEHLLHESGYDPGKTKFLIDGFTEGFELGYEGPRNIRMVANNISFREIGNDITLWNKVMKEVELHRFAGPFNKPPFEHFIQSPIGLVLKDGGRETRLIFHLSHPRNKGMSVNANIPAEKCKVSYPDFNKAVHLCLKAGRFCFLGKADTRSAFRNLGISVKDFCLLLLKARSPFDGEYYWFVDKCLPFGSSISCYLFQEFSDSVAHIVKYKTGEDLVNYLDDYLFVALLKLLCNRQIEQFLHVCHMIRFPISIEKTYWGTTCMTFLGFLIDTINQTVSLPHEKIIKGQILIDGVLSNKSGKITIKQLQRITGFLNFLGRCIIPGRAFTRRLYAYLGGENTKLKPHHHIRLNREIRSDLELWNVFIRHPSVFCRPFLDFSKKWNADEINILMPRKIVVWAMELTAIPLGFLESGAIL